MLSDREITPYFCWTKALDSLLAGFSAMISGLVCEFVATIYSSTNTRSVSQYTNTDTQIYKH